MNDSLSTAHPLALAPTINTTVTATAVDFVAPMQIVPPSTPMQPRNVIVTSPIVTTTTKRKAENRKKLEERAIKKASKEADDFELIQKANKECF